MSKNKYIPVRISEEDYEKLDYLKKKYGITKSEVMRRALNCMYDILSAKK